MAKLDDAIAAVLEASKPQGCWGSHLKGDAANFVARLREEEAKGTKVSRTATQKVLSDVFGVKIGTNAIADHLRGVCRCE